EARMPCGTRTRTLNHSGQLAKFVTSTDCKRYPPSTGVISRLHSKSPRRWFGSGKLWALSLASFPQIPPLYSVGECCDRLRRREPVRTVRGKMVRRKSTKEI